MEELGMPEDTLDEAHPSDAARFALALKQYKRTQEPEVRPTLRLYSPTPPHIQASPIDADQDENGALPSHNVKVRKLECIILPTVPANYTF